MHKVLLGAAAAAAEVKWLFVLLSPRPRPRVGFLCSSSSFDTASSIQYYAATHISCRRSLSSAAFAHDNEFVFPTRDGRKMPSRHWREKEFCGHVLSRQLGHVFNFLLSVVRRPACCMHCVPLWNAMCHESRLKCSMPQRRRRLISRRRWRRRRTQLASESRANTHTHAHTTGKTTDKAKL